MKSGKWLNITDMLSVMHRVSKVERINDRSFLLDLQIVVV